MTTKNAGWVSGIDIGGGSVGSTLPTGGDMVDCTLEFNGSAGGQAYSNYTVNFSNAMANTNYFIRISFVSQAAFFLDNCARVPVIKAITTTQFQFSISEANPGDQSLKLYFEIVQSAT